MKRRSRAGGEPIKGRRGKKPEPKRRNVPKTTAPFNASSAVEETKVARLTHELKEALEQQSATSEVLRVISGYPGDPQPVFQVMLKNAVRLCDAEFGNIYHWDGDALHLIATQNAPPAFAQARRLTTGRPGPKTPTGRMIANKNVVHIADLRAEKAYADRDPWIVTGVELGGVRTVLMVPMLKENKLIGAFSVYRQEIRPFTDRQIALAQNFSAQAVIAIENARLLNELRQRTTDLAEALEQQTATSEVLHVISGSPGDLQPVFAAMLENAARICDANFGNIFRWDGDALWLVATHNTPPAFAEHRKRVPFRPNQGNPIGNMLKANAAIHVVDLARDERYIQKRDPEVVAAVELGGIRTFVAVPMLKDEKLIGVIILYRQEVRPFSDKQIELVKNFAAQAVIAIENARLLNELRQRTTDLTEALEQQTATSEVLRVISSSAGDLEPVFASMLENAVRICDAKFGNIYRWDGEALHLLAAHDTPAALVEVRRRSALRPIALIRHMVATRTVAHVADLAASEDYVERHPAAVAAVELGGVRTALAVPMRKEDELIGSFTVYRQEVRPFTDKQIALVTNFAAQAVIAIENARLLNELRERTSDLTERTADLTEALDQQTATSEVLQVISSSPGDLEPVFQAMLENATRICEAKFGVVFSFDGNKFHFEAQVGTPPELAEFNRARPMPQPLPGSHLDRLRQTKRVSYTADYAAEGIPAPPVTLGGARSTVDVRGRSLPRGLIFILKSGTSGSRASASPFPPWNRTRVRNGRPLVSSMVMCS